ncbi:hypothetical protein F9K77_03795 [Ochrobactrum sp. LMG 5442]|nr:hypothetical protein F9K77_03795 [Ochrobactrum sp. LMG 5442]
MQDNGFKARCALIVSGAPHSRSHNVACGMCQKKCRISISRRKFCVAGELDLTAVKKPNKTGA